MDVLAVSFVVAILIGLLGLAGIYVDAEGRSVGRSGRDRPERYQ